MAHVAVFPGSFDPVHNGHIDVLWSAAGLFDTVYWAIGKNPNKHCMFSNNQRLMMMHAAVEELKLANVIVDEFDGLTVHYAKLHKAGYIVRSVRMAIDFEYEMQLAMLNKKVVPEVDTIYLPAQQNHLHISSTAVRELLNRDCAVSAYMPESVRQYIKGK